MTATPGPALGVPPSISAALGAPIATRGMGAAGRVFVLLLLLMVMLGCVGAAIASAVAAVQGRHSALIIGAIAAGFFFLCVLGVRGVFRTVTFHEGGVVETVLGRRREVLYQDITRMSYAITRQYVNGVYAGTTLSMGLRTADGGKMNYSGRYKEKPKGWAMTVFGRTFEGSDELDVVRDVVAAYIAARMTDAIARREAVEWPGCAVITADALTPLRGRRKGQPLAWNQFAGMSIEKGVLHLFAHGDTKSFLDVVVGAWNVFPCMELIGSLAGAGLGEVEQGERAM